MSRDDLLKANYDVVKAVVEQIVKHSPNCIIIVVTNPLDAMVQAAFKVSGFPKNPRAGYGRRAGLGAHELVCGDGVQGQRGKRALVRARRTRRRHGAAAALFDSGGNSSARFAADRTNRRDRGAHPQRRRRNREPAEDRIRVLRAVGSGSRNGRSDPEGQEEDSALRRVSRRRIRNQGIVRRRSREAGREGRRRNHSDQADSGRKCRPAEVRRHR